VHARTPEEYWGHILSGYEAARGAGGVVVSRTCRSSALKKGKKASRALKKKKRPQELGAHGYPGAVALSLEELWLFKKKKPKESWL